MPRESPGVVTGRDGVVFYSGGYNGTGVQPHQINRWDLRIRGRTADFTSMGFMWRDSIPGVRSWDGVYRAWIDSAALDNMDELFGNGPGALYPDPPPGGDPITYGASYIRLIFHIEESAQQFGMFEGYANVSLANPVVRSRSASYVDCAFEGMGHLRLLPYNP